MSASSGASSRVVPARGVVDHRARVPLDRAEPYLAQRARLTVREEIEDLLVVQHEIWREPCRTPRSDELQIGERGDGLVPGGDLREMMG
jgi:hypothetical protein